MFVQLNLAFSVGFHVIATAESMGGCCMFVDNNSVIFLLFTVTKFQVARS